MTATKSYDTKFESNDMFLIKINGGMYIPNDRSNQDNISMSFRYWHGLKEGIDGYPGHYYGYHLIDGGKDGFFKAIAIEFYAVYWKNQLRSSFT